MKPVSIPEFVKQVKMEKISVVEHTQRVLEEIYSSAGLNHFSIVAGDYALQQAREIEAGIKTGRHRGRLLGVPISVKDCICVKGVESRAGSKILSGYVPPFDATAVARAKAEGAIIIGKTSQDEFGFGSFNVNTGIGFPIPRNPLDARRSCGGSSGGSAGFTALTKFTHAGIAESTGGSIACPASFCGVVGFTPTYGRVSRYGLIDYANSLDKIGSMGKSVEDAALLLEVMSGHDGGDSTSLAEAAPRLAGQGGNCNGLKIGIAAELFGKSSSEVQKKCMAALGAMEKQGAVLKEISLPLNSEFGIPAYYIISMSEASTNLARYCGMRYGLHGDLSGNFDEYFSKVRGMGFGKEAKRRILLGTFARMAGYRDAYYLRAAKARTVLIMEFRRAFESVDVIASPTMPTIAPRFSEIQEMSPAQQYAMDLCTVPPNLAGLPHISVNAGYSKKLPVGLLLSAWHLQEEKLVRAAKAVEGAVQ
jgi:aspartyl-tRNA(Asn)/glutamyl-tRNA(Gln) amidotransferase subunit A